MNPEIADVVVALEARVKVLEEALEGMVLSVGKKPEIAAKLLASARSALSSTERKV